MADLKGIRVAILASDGVEQSELTEPQKFLQQLGAEVQVLSPDGEAIQAMQHDEKTGKIPAQGSIEQARSREYDAVLLPGGALNSDKLRMNQGARRFVKEMDGAQKPVAAICHAPWLLISAGLVKGRSMTSYSTIQDDLRTKRRMPGHFDCDKSPVRIQRCLATGQAMVTLLESGLTEASAQQYQRGIRFLLNTQAKMDPGTFAGARFRSSRISNLVIRTVTTSGSRPPQATGRQWLCYLD